MKLTTFSDEAWGFSVLAGHEVELLRNIASAADPVGCGDAERRLYQPPMDEPGEEEKTFLDDWEDFVTIEYRQQFVAAVAVVEGDLGGIEPCTDDCAAGQEGEAELFSLRIPVAHAESWFSALNQARLVLANRFELFDSRGEEAVSVSWDEGRPVATLAAGSANAHSPNERVFAYFRSQAFGFIQEWIVANVFTRGF